MIKERLAYLLGVAITLIYYSQPTFEAIAAQTGPQPNFTTQSQNFDFLCIPPERPNLDVSADLAKEYRAEISAEVEAYFTDISRYITCLGDERARAMKEAQDVTREYTDFFNR